MAVWVVAFAPRAFAQEESPADTDELKQLSLEELMNVEVSITKRPEKLSEVASALHVITQDDIRRSGAASIPEALRLAPNLHVAQVNSQSWSISARGMNETFAGTAVANKLLVMIDGRTVYTPLFSGVFWDVQDTFMDDIERIEVVSGPGATLWGANAVNGVINVVTRSALDPSSHGTFVYGGAGTREQGFGGLRYGAALSEAAGFRIYAKAGNHDSSRLANGSAGGDEWNMFQGGFRSDWTPGDGNHLTFQGDLYSGERDQFAAMDTRVAGGNLLTRWTHDFTDDSSVHAQF